MMKMHIRKNAILSLTLVLLILVMLVPATAHAAIETRNIPISISWAGGATSANLPDSLTLNLKQVGPLGTYASYRTTTLQKSTFGTNTTWTGSFLDVPKTTVGRTPYTYSVAWPSVSGFKIVASPDIAYSGSAAATYMYNSVSGSYPVSIVWGGGEPTSYTRPSKVTVQLNNAKTATGNNPQAEITGTAWTHTFNVTDVVTAGVPISVQLVSPPAGYKVDYAFDGTQFTITLTYNSDFSGTITWVNAPRFNKPDVKIQIGAEGTSANDITSCFNTRTDEDTLSYTISGLNPDVTYVIKSVSVIGTMADDNNYATPTWSGHNITIGRKWNPLMRIGVHMRWIDNNNKRERRPIETTLYLYRDDVYTGDAEQIRESDGWDAIFYDQPYSDGKHVYTYSVRPAKTPYYWSRCTRLSSTGLLVTQYYGTKASSSSETTTGLTPKVGDPTLFRSVLSDKMYAAAAASMQAIRNAAVHKDNENATGTVDFDTLKRLNKDVVGWITLAGTNIDYPIVKGTNNTDYLTRLFSGEANSAGSLFMDYHNNSKFTNRNTTVFGHNMKDGSMFNALLQYADQSFYAAHPSFNIQTPSGAFTAEPIAAFYTDSAYSNVVKRTFANNAAFLKYVDKCIRASTIQSSITVGATDKLVTFVTCDNDYTASKRFMVVCKLTPVD